jgi:hypothetical protein
MVRARDVIFDEDQIFDGSLEKLQDDCVDIDLEDLSTLLTQLDVSQKHENDSNSDGLGKPLSSDLVGKPGALEGSVNELNNIQELHS